MVASSSGQAPVSLLAEKGNSCSDHGSILTEREHVFRKK